MKNGTIKFWWLSEGKNGEEVTEEICETVLDALWMSHCKAVHEVNNEDIAFNVCSIMYYDEEFLRPQYDCEDGFTDFYTYDGDEPSDILGEVYDINSEDQNWIYTTKEQIKKYLYDENILPENNSIKMY